MLSTNKLGVRKITNSLCFTRFVMLIVATIFGSHAYANGGGPLQDAVVYTVPENLASLSTEEITELRAVHQRDLGKTTASVDAEKNAEDELFKQLMAHDLVRLSIADVIPKLINDYEIDGEFKKTLMGYRSTFADELIASRENVENLQDYPSYDFRFAAVYMSMLYAFQKYPDFYERLKIDMVNEETSIGSYRETLDDSYEGVKKARAEINMMSSSDDLEKVIAALDDELARRDN